MADEKVPEHLEYKNTKGTVLGYTAATVPNTNRVGAELSADERKTGDGVVGSPAQGNGLTNEHLQSVGITTDAAGTQTAPALGKTESAGKTAAPRRS